MEFYEHLITDKLDPNLKTKSEYNLVAVGRIRECYDCTSQNPAQEEDLSVDLLCISPTHWVYNDLCMAHIPALLEECLVHNRPLVNIC